MYMCVIVELHGMVPVYSLNVTVKISWHKSLYADTGGIFIQMPGKLLVGTGRSVVTASKLTGYIVIQQANDWDKD